ncbi:hypothetical protein DFQ28_000040 [Apophysomyces sp. BC1034]|nr:hypothetical protein DFQ28_000040 [Apophysomyces sp. BC1034]
MAFLSGFVKSGLSLLGKDSSAFPYSLGDKVEWFNDFSIWSLHQGIKKEDGSQVSVFVFDCTKNRDKIQLARNAFRRLRTIRHPDLLRYIDGVENEQAIMFVTDPVEPLSNQLSQDPDKNLMLWGLYKVANAIKFINSDCNMVHGNVQISSIFTNKAGEWKLGGFELLSSMKDESPIILTFGGLVPGAQKYASPEVKKSGWTAIKNLPTTAVDSYHLGCLIYEAYNRRFDTTDQLLQRKDIPITMSKSYESLIRSSPTARADAEAFLDAGLASKGFFTVDFIQVNLFLESISIKDQSEKEGFFSEFAKHKILPELVNAFEFGSGGAKALNAILKIGEHLPEDEYESVLVGPIVRMFASPDRAIRVSLLENMPKFVDHIPNKTISNQIFPHVEKSQNISVRRSVRIQAFKTISTFINRLQEFADDMPETALTDIPTGTPSNQSETTTVTSSVTSSAAMSMAGAFGGATKGLAGWAVSSINARFISPSGEIENPITATDQKNSVERDTPNRSPTFTQHQPHNLSPTGAEDYQDGWNSEPSADFLGFDDNDGWEPFEGTAKEEPEPITSLIPPANSTLTISSFAVNDSPISTNRAGSSMKLGHKTKISAFEPENDNHNMHYQSTPNVTSSPAAKEDRKAELERRREERRQRMAELREKKKSGIGAKKLDHTSIT